MVKGTQTIAKKPGQEKWGRRESRNIEKDDLPHNRRSLHRARAMCPKELATTV